MCVCSREQQVIYLTAEQKADIASHDADELRRELVRIDEDIKKYSDRFEVLLILIFRFVPKGIVA